MRVLGLTNQNQAEHHNIWKQLIIRLKVSRSTPNAVELQIAYLTND